MKKRGRILRDPRFGAGLLMVEGRQYPFALGIWKSDALPKPALVVDVEVDDGGTVQSVTAVPDSLLAEEQAQAMRVLAHRKDGASTATVFSKAGGFTLIGAGLLAVAWWFLTAVSIQMPFPGKVDFTFREVLGFLSAGNAPDLLGQYSGPGAGIYGGIAVLALLGPFVHLVWHDKRAALGGLLPLVFMVVVGIMARSSVGSSIAANAAIEPAKQVRGEAMKAVSLGPGSYLSLAICLYFAFASVKRFLISKGGKGREIPPSRRKAA